METEERKSGLVVPKQKPEPPPKQYGPLELTDTDKRERAKVALRKLWTVAGLECPCGILFISEERKIQLAAREWAWKMRTFSSGRKKMTDQTADAFNAWMDDYTNHPELFNREWQTVGKYLAERNGGETPSYGAHAAETLQQYIDGHRIGKPSGVSPPPPPKG
jgi:hypothetical protein